MKNKHHLAAFTIVELLVVIGIILILMAFLFPMIKSVRSAAYAASTQSEIAVLTSAINQYYADFSAYPGPLSEDQLCNPAVQAPISTDISTPNQSDPLNNISGSENLVLGLLGGLKFDTPNDGLFGFDKTTVGLGPLSLNVLNPRRFSSYIQSNSSYLSQGQFLDQAGRYCADTAIPEFVDQFPDPLPIIYVRARRGAPGVLGSSSNVSQNPPINGQTAIQNYQYNINQVWTYVLAYDPPNTPPPSGQCIGLPWNNGNTSTSQWHGLRNMGAAYSSTVTSYNSDGFNSNGAWDGLAYFTNPNSSSTNPTARCPDSYVLISAGKDRTYGSADDITNFGSPQ